MDIVLKSKVTRDKYTQFVEDTFDLKIEDVAQVNIPNRLYLNNIGEWNIGVICGASGSGKSTILRTIGGGQIASS